MGRFHANHTDVPHPPPGEDMTFLDFRGSGKLVGTVVNFAEVGGNCVAVAVSNAWYPDTRTAADNAEKLGIQLATDAFSNVLKEFWPDVKRYWQRKRRAKEAQSSGALP